MRIWKRITIVSSIVRSPDVNVPENGYLTPEYYTENQTIAKKPLSISLLSCGMKDKIPER